MPTIKIETSINSTLETCFDLSRSIDFHKITTSKTKEIAIDGITCGLIKLGEYVTWQATHFGIRQTLSSKITAFDRPFHFRDEQLKGIFKFIIHDHYFTKNGNFILMKDIFKYQSPLGIIGKFFDKIVLTNYLTKLLVNRNILLKKYAETDKWKIILDG